LKTRPVSISSTKPFLSFQNATFRLGDRLVFQNTNWKWHEGEHWAALGPNGSGKSLFGDALRGKLPLVKGEMSYHFRAAPNLSPEEMIGHVAFEERKPTVHDLVVQSRWNSLEQDHATTVRDFLSYEQIMELNPFELRPQAARERQAFARRFQKAVSLFEIKPLVTRRLMSLSNGETQRVQLARALCRPLRLLILDEPFNGLDAATRRNFGVALERLMQTPIGVLLITTRIEDLPRHTTHVLWLNDCQVSAAAPRNKLSTLRVLRHASSLRRSQAAPGAGSSRAAAVRSNAATSRTKLVELRDVSVKYGGHTIIERLNWTIRSGESWALLGPNGSGKTTLLSLILGDNPQAYRNHIEVFGHLRGTGESIWELKKRIGWVSPELQAYFPESVSCLDAVASGFQETAGLFEPVSRAQRAAVRKWLKRFELLEQAHQPLFTLSAGLQRMVLLARALVKKPALLLLDEPCQGLDTEHCRSFIRMLDGLIRRQEVTAIYVTHRMDEIPPSIRCVLRLHERRGKVEHLA
jgi:molybdate transport system ATP-binding protein